MLQPDLGTGTVMVGTCMIMIFVAGAKISSFYWTWVSRCCRFCWLIFSRTISNERITSYLDPWSDPLGTGFQIIQSLYAIGPGGLFGLGLGQSRQKFFYLPEPQTDFIYAILAEELGFIGGAFVLLLFALLLWRGIRVRIKCARFIWKFFSSWHYFHDCSPSDDQYWSGYRLNPVTGITLPFFSYGGHH